MRSDKFNFHKKIEALQKAKHHLPNDLAQAGQLYFQQNFNKQQWDGVAWKPRKDNKSPKPLLVKTGILKQAMQRTIVSKDYKKIVWGVDKNVDYAKYLNFGTPKMVARQFMGIDKKFISLMKRKINLAFNKVMFAK